MISAGWRKLYLAQRKPELAVTGIYAHVRHPQYTGFILVMFGFLLQWPTLLTLAMFPVLTFMYVRLARSEEREAIAGFGDAYRSYMQRVPAFVPRWRPLLRGVRDAAWTPANAHARLRAGQAGPHVRDAHPGCGSGLRRARAPPRRDSCGTWPE